MALCAATEEAGQCPGSATGTTGENPYHFQPSDREGTAAADQGIP